MNISLTISIIALTISVATFWFTQIRRGRIYASRPTLMYLQGSRRTDDETSIINSSKTISLSRPMICIRTVLHTNGKRGQLITGMFVVLKPHFGMYHYLTRWFYGDNSIKEGCGFWVGENGLMTTHYFLTDDRKIRSFGLEFPPYELFPGTYTIELYSVLSSGRRSSPLYSFTISLKNEDILHLNEDNVCLYITYEPIQDQSDKNPFQQWFGSPPKDIEFDFRHESRTIR